MRDPDPSRSPVSRTEAVRAADLPVTRRVFVGAAASAVAAIPLHAGAQSTPDAQQPVSTPVSESTINPDALTRVSLALVGGGSFAGPALETLGGLISADPDRVAAFDDLVRLDDPSTDEALEAMSREARALVDDIVEFWYLGSFDGKPVENRAELYFQLPVWSSVPYVTQPTLCKAFGYWATDVAVE